MTSLVGARRTSGAPLNPKLRLSNTRTNVRFVLPAVANRGSYKKTEASSPPTRGLVGLLARTVVQSAFMCQAARPSVGKSRAA